MFPDEQIEKFALSEKDKETFRRIVDIVDDKCKKENQKFSFDPYPFFDVPFDCIPEEIKRRRRNGLDVPTQKPFLSTIEFIGRIGKYGKQVYKMMFLNVKPGMFYGYFWDYGIGNFCIPEGDEPIELLKERHVVGLSSEGFDTIEKFMDRMFEKKEEFEKIAKVNDFKDELVLNIAKKYLQDNFFDSGWRKISDYTFRWNDECTCEFTDWQMRIRFIMHGRIQFEFEIDEKEYPRVTTFIKKKMQQLVTANKVTHMFKPFD